MITSLFLNLLYGLVYVITSPLRLLPDVSINSNMSDAIATAGTYLNSLNGIVDIVSFLAVLTVLIAFEGGIFIFKGIVFGIKKVPTIN